MITMARVKGVKVGRKKKTSSTKQQPTKAAPTVSVAWRAQLDRAALEYRRLLLNPCDAPLVRGLYASGGQGITVRTEISFNVNTTALSTAGYVRFAPGCFGSTAVGVTYAGDSTTSAAAAPNATALGFVPGLTFMNANAQSVRPVAACMQVMYAGSESARSGIIYLGQTPASYVSSGSAPIPDSIANGLTHCERMPTGAVEAIWRPGTTDDQFVDTFAPATEEGKNALVLAWIGAPAAVPIRVRLVCVWEFKVNKGYGLVDDNASAPASSNTFNDVMRTLQNSSAQFVRKVGNTAASHVGAALGANAMDYVQAVAYGNVRNGRGQIVTY